MSKKYLDDTGINVLVENMKQYVDDSLAIVPIEKITDFGAEMTVSAMNDSLQDEIYGGGSYRRDIVINSEMINPTNFIFKAYIPDGYAVQYPWFKFKSKSTGIEKTIAASSFKQEELLFHISNDTKNRKIIIDEMYYGKSFEVSYDENGDFVSLDKIENITDYNLLSKLNSKTKSESYAPSADTDMATKEYVDDLAVQPDWNENDESSSAYVKNRTHWCEERYYNYYETQLDSSDFTKIANNNSKFAPIIKITPIETIPDGSINLYARATVNDTEYILEPTTLGYGNLSFYNKTAEDTGEDVFVFLTNNYIGVFIRETCILDTNDIKVELFVQRYEQIDLNYLRMKPGVDVSGETFTIPKSADIFTSSSTPLNADNTIEKVASNGAEVFNCGFRTKLTNTRTNTATGSCSHAEGIGSYAIGTCSHAEGWETTAYDTGSHTEGLGTVAGSLYQHVEGKLNIVDSEKRYVHIVGNGEDGGARSNAHTLDWNGNAWFQGDVYVGGSGQDEGTRLVSETDLDNMIATDDDLLELLSELNLASPIATQNDEILTSSDGTIYYV